MSFISLFMNHKIIKNKFAFCFLLFIFLLFTLAFAYLKDWKSFKFMNISFRIQQNLNEMINRAELII